MVSGYERRVAKDLLKVFMSAVYGKIPFEYSYCVLERINDLSIIKSLGLGSQNITGFML